MQIISLFLNLTDDVGKANVHAGFSSLATLQLVLTMSQCFQFKIKRQLLLFNITAFKYIKLHKDSTFLAQI